MFKNEYGVISRGVQKPTPDVDMILNATSDFRSGIRLFSLLFV
jgi:hypothetical protein